MIELNVEGLTKVCSKCFTKKSLNDFYADNSIKSGKKSYCKHCAAQIRKNWIAINPNKKIEYYKKYRPKRRLIEIKARQIKNEKNRCVLCSTALHDRVASTKYCINCKKIKEKEWAKKDYESNKENYYKLSKKHSKTDSYKAWRRKRKGKIISELNDSYVKDRLAQQGYTNITPEIIELKKIQMQLKRIIKSKENETRK